MNDIQTKSNDDPPVQTTKYCGFTSCAEAWMTRQGAAKGFEPRMTIVEGYSTIELGRRRRQGATFGILDLTGEIAVTDPDAFLPALAAGFGRARAWGCGLMLIRRVR